MKIEVTFGWVLAILLQSLDGEERAGTGSQNRTANSPLSKHKLCSMWDSILNYSVYTVSGRGNGQSITDGGQSASTQQVKEASKVKQSSKGHIRGHFWKDCLCRKEAISSLIIFLISFCSLPPKHRDVSARSMKPNPPQFESLLKDVKDGSTSQLRKCSWCLFLL